MTNAVMNSNQAHPRWALRVMTGTSAGRQFSIPDGLVVLGSAAGVQVQIPVVSVAPRHCQFIASSMALSVMPFALVELNGKAITSRATVDDGDVLQIGPLRFQIIDLHVSRIGPKSRMWTRLSYQRTWNSVFPGASQAPKPGLRFLLVIVGVIGVGFLLFSREDGTKGAEIGHANPPLLSPPKTSSEPSMNPPNIPRDFSDAAGELTRVFNGWIVQHNIGADSKIIYLRASSCIQSVSLGMGNDVFALFMTFPLEWQFTRIEPTIYQDHLTEADRLNAIQYRLAMTVQTGAWRTRQVEMAVSGGRSGRIGDWSEWHDGTDFFVTLGGMVLSGLPLQQTDQGYLITFVKLDGDPHWLIDHSNETREFPGEFFRVPTEDDRPECTELFLKQ